MWIIKVNTRFYYNYYSNIEEYNCWLGCKKNNDYIFLSLIDDPRINKIDTSYLNNYINFDKHISQHSLRTKIYLICG